MQNFPRNIYYSARLWKYELLYTEHIVRIRAHWRLRPKLEYLRNLERVHVKLRNFNHLFEDLSGFVLRFGFFVEWLENPFKD